MGLGFGFGLGLGSEGSTLPAPALPPLRAPKPVLTPPGLNGSVRPRLIEALVGVRVQIRVRVRVRVSVRVGAGARVRVRVRVEVSEALGGGLGVVAARTLPMLSARPRLAGTLCRSHQSKAFAGAPR